ncbi:MAG: mandelate racemase/muconate lactonizing enzyme family protein [Desulfobacca sp.]|uniref:mandelate racemase/muconate lactonizing enzyme family protein n=1 Tax=Desulfobacca sp. TaxID=2067990 RepID=UPI004049698F
MILRFTRLELREITIPFRFAFKHSLAERRQARNLILTLSTDAGSVGYGEVIPRRYLTGETIGSAWEDIRSQFWPAVRDLRLTDSLSPWATLQPLFAWASGERRTAAYAGIDLAVWDAWARAVCRPGYSLFGQRRPLPVPLTGPLGAGSFDYLRRTAKLMKFLGFLEYKLKVGNVQDLHAVQLLRRIIGPRCDLRVDANAGWQTEQAIAMMRKLQRFGVSSVEQPIPAGDVQELARVQRQGGLPVVADESLCTLADARQLLAEQAADIWNLRLAKIGGFTGFLALLQVAGYPLPAGLHGDRSGGGGRPSLAHTYRPRIYLGVLVGETSLITAAGRACLGLCPFIHVEYGYPRILLKLDPFQGDPGGYSGTATPLGEVCGLGVTPRPRLLERLTVRREVLE